MFQLFQRLLLTELEGPFKSFQETFFLEMGKAPQEPMCRQDHESRIVQVREIHRNEIVRLRSRMAWILEPQSVGIDQSRLVTVVPVGNEHVLSVQELCEGKRG